MPEATLANMMFLVMIIGQIVYEFRVNKLAKKVLILEIEIFNLKLKNFRKGFNEDNPLG
jgi:hypothetical protein